MSIHSKMQSSAGAAPGVAYGSAVTEFVSGSLSFSRISMGQSVVLVTAYSSEVQGVVNNVTAIAISALSTAMAAQIHHDTDNRPHVHLVPASPHLEFYRGRSIGKVYNSSSSSTENVQQVLVGVIVDHTSPRQRSVLENQLTDVSVVSKVHSAANALIDGMGGTILHLEPSLVIPTVMLDVSCSRASCDTDANFWAAAVHGAAEAEHLQQPDDVWVFNTVSGNLVPVSEDFESLFFQKRLKFPWHLLLFGGFATLSAVTFAVAVYVSLSQSRWNQPRTKMWEGYSAAGGPAGAVGEAINISSPLSMSDVSPLSRNSIRARLTHECSAMDEFRDAVGYSNAEQSWADYTAKAPSKMYPLVVCRETDDDLPGTATMPSLPSGVSWDSQQLRGVIRCGFAEAERYFMTRDGQKLVS